MLAERTGMPLSARQVSSALAAGCHAALVQRPGVVASPLGAQPDIVGPTLTEVVDQIFAGRQPEPAEG
jgi:hypothetical protein